MKVKQIQTKLFESNKSQAHTNKAFWIKCKSIAFKNASLNQMKVEHIQTKHFESNESQMHLTKLIELNESRYIQTKIYESIESQMHSTS